MTKSITSDQPVISIALVELDPELAGILADLAKLKEDCEEDYQLLLDRFV